MNRRDFLKSSAAVTTVSMYTGCDSWFRAKTRPNVLWIVVEDMSAHWSCYGETTITTPNIDRLAAEGAKFERAFVTCPVCSPCRSALVSGMYQTKLGAHHHRSQRAEGRVAGDPPYHDSYRIPVDLLPVLFQKAGYYTILGGPQGRAQEPGAGEPRVFIQEKAPSANQAPSTQGAASAQNAASAEKAASTGQAPQEQPVPEDKNLAKSDYNFVWDDAIYDGNDWSGRAPDQPFFAQIQLKGGKARGAQVEHPVDPAAVNLPPYYPDHPVLRQDWANYLNSVLKLDREVGEILARLDEENIASETAVFLFTDHGISHLRGKQFLYEEGLRVPMIARWPGVIPAGSVRRDLVSLIDVSATSLDIAGIRIPDYVDGQPLLGSKFEPREYIAAARDRCDETIDGIRCIRTERYKYIRNFYAHRSHMQPNQYKDGKEIVQVERALFAAGRLDPLQADIFAPNRSPEEFYDLQEDPLEINNRIHDRALEEQIQQHRLLLREWMRETRDLGLIPEPELEELGRQMGNKYDILRDKSDFALIDRIFRVIEWSEHGESNLPNLIETLSDPSPAVRFWAAYGIGHLRGEGTPAAGALLKSLNDESGSVRAAAARALCLMERSEEGLPALRHELLENSNHAVRHYAALFYEDLGAAAGIHFTDFQKATGDSYEYVRRVARRLVETLGSPKSAV